MKFLIFRRSLFVLSLFFLLVPTTGWGAGKIPTIPEQKWSFSGLFGTFDRAAAKRGFQVYTEVCSGCHSLNLLSYRHLTGVGFKVEEVKIIVL